MTGAAPLGVVLRTTQRGCKRVRQRRRNERGEARVPDQAKTGNPMGAFGPNEWLVDELYPKGPAHGR